MGERGRLLVIVLLVLACAPACSAFLNPTDPSVMKFTATEDDGFSAAVSFEYTVNRGKCPSIRCKSNQEMVIMKFDLSSLAGRTITEAELHVGASSPSLLYAADVCTICVPWSEGHGTGEGYENALPGDPCWTWRRYPADPANPQPEDYWLPGATDFTFASYGNNGSLVSWAYPGNGGFTTYTAATPGGPSTFYRIRLDPDIVHALILDQYGLTLSDTRGYPLQNNTVYLRDQWDGEAGPWLYVKAAVTDTTPPGAVTGFAAKPAWDGQVLLSWVAPTDSGPKGKAFGYDVRYSTAPITTGNFAAATPVDRWRIPRPAAAGAAQKMLVEGLTPNTTYYFAMKAYDQAGNAPAIVTASVVLPPVQGVRPFNNGNFTVPTAAAAVRDVPNVLRYWAVSDYTKVNPVGGNQFADGYTGAANDGYKKGNPVWDAANNKVVLKASRNEVAAFQVILQRIVSSLTNVRVAVSDLTGPGTITTSPNIELFRTWYVYSGGAYYPHACIPLTSPFGTSFAIPNANNGIFGQANQAVWVDIYVPKTTPVGTYNGTITVTASQLPQPLQIAVQLDVRRWQLPDQVSFVLDLNGYHMPWDWGDVPATRLSYFQLAHKHRQNVNTVPQSHQLNSGDFSPRLDAERVPALSGSGANIHVSDWTAFDNNWGHFFDGSAFTAAKGYNGPGMNTPIIEWFTPFFESWPLSSYYWYDATGLGGAYWYNLWPDGAYPPVAFLTGAPDPATAYPTSYETGVKNVVRDFVQHAQAKGWHGTNFEFFLNNKSQYGTAASPHSQFWNLDEPTDGDCMRALGYFMRIFREGVESAGGPDVKCDYRIDISTRTGFHRAAMDGIVNVWSCSGISDYHGLIAPRQMNWPDERWWYYGGGSSSRDGSMVNSKRFLQVWAWGADGALPYWNAYGNQGNWYGDGDPNAVLMAGAGVPGASGTYNGALPTVRMKEMRRGQQDIEYLACLATNGNGWDRAAVVRALQQQYADAGGQSYGGMTDLKFFQMRENVAATITLTGDANGDGYVNVGDLQILVAAWGTTQGTPNYNAQADFNGDHVINVGDLQLLVANWGR